MALTIEKLFNFQEKRDAREALGNLEDYRAGANFDTKNPFKAIGQGVNKISRNLFNNNDKQLQDEVAVEQAMQLSQSNLSSEDMADPIKLYTSVFENLKDTGVSSKILASLSGIIEKTKIDRDTSKGNLSYKTMMAKNAMDVTNLNQANKDNQLKTKRGENFIKMYENVLKSPTVDLNRQILEFTKGDKDLATKLQTRIKRDASTLYINDTNLTVPSAIDKVIEELKKNYDVDSPNGLMSFLGKDATLKPKGVTGVEVPDEALKKTINDLVTKFSNTK